MYGYNSRYAVNMYGHKKCPMEFRALTEAYGIETLSYYVGTAKLVNNFGMYKREGEKKSEKMRSAVGTLRNTTRLVVYPETEDFPFLWIQFNAIAYDVWSVNIATTSFVTV